MTSDDQEKKIIIDEDWKSQVEREKEELAGVQSHPSEAAEANDMGPEPDLPAASLAFLISTMVAQTMASMGQLPDPVSGKPEIRLKFAKHHIDMLAVLQEKTQGNATAEEAQMLEESLHQLRMMFVALESQLASQS